MALVTIGQESGYWVVRCGGQQIKITLDKAEARSAAESHKRMMREREAISLAVRQRFGFATEISFASLLA